MTNIPTDSSRKSPDFARIRTHLIDAVQRDLEANPPPVAKQREAVVKSLEEAYDQTKLNLSRTLQAQLFQNILDDLVGYGPIQPLLNDESVTEVMVNGAKNVYVERNGVLEKTGIRFEDDAHVVRIIERIVLPLGRHIDHDSPTVDARLPDGSRVNAIIPPVAIDGPTITVRKFSKKKLGVDDMIGYGSITETMAQFLETCVNAHLNILISGGTGSGKTTLLNVLSGFIPSQERIVTIEDAAELQLQQEHVVRLETKVPNVDGVGEVRIRDLVRNSLRMRPDRIVVGEVRGGEALDMLQAMNTGHDGSLTTVHANSPRDALSRVETLTMMAGMDLPVKIVREQIASAIDLIVQLSRLTDGARKITHITEVAGMEGDTVVMTDIFTFNQTGTTPEGMVTGELQPTGIRPLFMNRLLAAGFSLGAKVFIATNSDQPESSRRPRRR
jgi:pilus assembly protein CpaF